MRLFALLSVILGSLTSLYGHDEDPRGMADKHAPAGLMGDHVHKRGEWMVEYKYMNMYMDDNRIGATTITDPTLIRPITIGGITTNGGATPTQMTMEMHMVHLMHGLTDDVTVYTMLMLPSLTMDHTRGPGNPAVPGLVPLDSPFTTHNSGMGDTSFGALWRIYKDVDDDVILNLGFSVPTGDIFRTSSAPTAGLVALPLPYPMRLGSGTFNAKPGITWKRYAELGSFGTQFQTDLPIGRNYRNYAVSDIYQLNNWFSLLVTKNVALTFRLENLWKSNFSGEDPSTPNLLISTNVEQFRGGYWLNIGLGAAVLADGHLFNMEFVPTIFQDVNGIQLEQDWMFVVSWSKGF